MGGTEDDSLDPGGPVAVQSEPAEAYEDGEEEGEGLAAACVCESGDGVSG